MALPFREAVGVSQNFQEACGDGGQVVGQGSSIRVLGFRVLELKVPVTGDRWPGRALPFCEAGGVSQF